MCWSVCSSRLICSCVVHMFLMCSLSRHNALLSFILHVWSVEREEGGEEFFQTSVVCVVMLAN